MAPPSFRSKANPLSLSPLASSANDEALEETVKRNMETKTIDYTLLPPVGTGRLYIKGTLTDLVRAIPSLIFLSVIPPLNILNEVLRTGRREAGMSGGAEWKPFEASLEEYETLVEDLESYPEIDYYFVQPPSEITECEQWWRWVLQQRKENNK